MKIEVNRRANERPTCAFCRDEVQAEEALALCPACGCTFHEDCRDELSRCPTNGCVGLDPAAFAARRSADEAAERAARRAAARARREAEDAAARARREAGDAALADAPAPPGEGGAPPAPPGSGSARVRLVAPGAAALAEAVPEVGVIRPGSGAELVGWLLGAGAVGAAIGFAAAFLGSRHDLEPAQVRRWVPLFIGAGVVQVLLIAAFGVRAEPRFQAEWRRLSGGKRQRTDPGAGAVVGAAVACAALGSMSWACISPLAGGLVGGMFGLALGLRWAGFGSRDP